MVQSPPQTEKPCHQWSDAQVKSRAIWIFIGVIAAVTLVLIVEILLAINGPLVNSTPPDRNPMHFGTSGSSVIYVVMGDSTAAGRGADAGRGIAFETARHLALSHQVTMINLSASGARTHDVLIQQTPTAENLHADVILLSVGANDVTHFTTGADLRSDFKAMVSRLTRSNPRVKIVVPGSGDLGASPRFAEPLASIAGLKQAALTRISMHLSALFQMYSGCHWPTLQVKRLKTIPVYFRLIDFIQIAVATMFGHRFLIERWIKHLPFRELMLGGLKILLLADLQIFY